MCAPPACISFMKAEASGYLILTRLSPGRQAGWITLCQPDEPLDSLTCSNHGVAQILDGEAVCACATGYVGVHCTVCAPDYALNPAGTQCVAAPPPAPAAVIEGIQQSIEQGAAIPSTAAPARRPRLSAALDRPPS